MVVFSFSIVNHHFWGYPYLWKPPVGKRIHQYLITFDLALVRSHRIKYIRYEHDYKMHFHDDNKDALRVRIVNEYFKAKSYVSSQGSNHPWGR